LMRDKPNTISHGVSYFLLGEGTATAESVPFKTADVNC